jgi:heptosyltransferase-2
MRNKASVENVKAKPWAGKAIPKRILVIRLQAMGDMVITLPYIQYLKRNLPDGVVLDFLTREEVDAIPRNIHLFNSVFSIKGKRNFKKQFLYTLTMLPKLLLRRYEVVIDLQNNPLSRLVTKTITPKAWSLFDRFSPMPAGERTRLTIEAVGLGVNMPDHNFTLRTTDGVDDLLTENGWDGESMLVILNPAGAFATRNWPLDNYIQFARLWLAAYPDTQFITIGINIIAEKAVYLQHALDDKLINLVNKTNPAQAFAIVQKATFVLSEDSGLMHMAWVSGIPTLAIFGGTRSDWCRPLGTHTAFIDSSDLPCGNCMLEVCKFGDNHCLTRNTPEIVFTKTLGLLKSMVDAE